MHNKAQNKVAKQNTRKPVIIGISSVLIGDMRHLKIKHKNAGSGTWTHTESISISLNFCGFNLTFCISFCINIFYYIRHLSLYQKVCVSIFCVTLIYCCFIKNHLHKYLLCSNCLYSLFRILYISQYIRNIDFFKNRDSRNSYPLFLIYSCCRVLFW